MKTLFNGERLIEAFNITILLGVGAVLIGYADLYDQAADKFEALEKAELKSGVDAMDPDARMKHKLLAQIYESKAQAARVIEKQFQYPGLVVGGAGVGSLIYTLASLWQQPAAKPRPARK